MTSTLRERQHSKARTKERIVEAVADAQADGDVDIGGGVPTEEIVNRTGTRPQTVRNYASELVEEGRLAIQHGFKPGRISNPRRGYQAPNDEEVSD